jgi:hypothetical protein
MNHLSIKVIVQTLRSLQIDRASVALGEALRLCMFEMRNFGLLLRSLLKPNHVVLIGRPNIRSCP